jgi:mercuric reductase
MMDVQSAVDRLNSQLPLKVRQDQLSPELRQLHQEILQSLVKRGKPLSNAEISKHVGDAGLASTLRTLGENDLVVLNADGKSVVGAYPVTIEQTPHMIQVGANTIYAMCALDAVSVAPMFDTEVTIKSQCYVTAEPVEIQMRGFDVLHASPADVCVGIRWQMPQGSAAHSMCMQMVFLKDAETARQWQGDQTASITIFSLPDAIAFGAAFFMPIMQDAALN